MGLLQRCCHHRNLALLPRIQSDNALVSLLNATRSSSSSTPPSSSSDHHSDGRGAAAAAKSGGGGGGVLAAYAARVQAGELSEDATQLRAAQALELLQRVVVARAANCTAEAAAAAPSQEQQQQMPSPPAVQGAYLWGPVGGGKTLLLDLFASTLPPAVRARRLHLHELLADVHAWCHAAQEALPKVVVKSRLGLPVYRCVLFAPHFTSPFLSPLLLLLPLSNTPANQPKQPKITKQRGRAARRRPRHCRRARPRARVRRALRRRAAHGRRGGCADARAAV